MTDDLELLGYIAMCIRMKLNKDKKSKIPPLARIERGEKALNLIYNEMNELRQLAKLKDISEAM